VLNVVEEMAIASGVPVPPVYMIQEHGINAFAAGFSPEDAVIGVTRGAVETLSRDELQGVMAHEFSHILNGDMRMNIRLMGVIHGILVIGLIGYFLMRASFYSSGYSSRRRSNDGGGIVLLGLALVAIGFVGTFFGNLIKAAVSRQREFLADASAVQFTRNPHGIAGALKKIGGWKAGSQLENPKAQEASHMMFGSTLTSSLTQLFATHPPLAQRIRKIDPGFDGDFQSSTVEHAAGVSSSPAMGISQMTGTPQQDAISQIGKPTPAHVDYAAHLIAALPQRIRQIAREPFGARALVYALLIDTDETPRQKQLQRLAQFADPPVYQLTQAILPQMQKLPASARLPLIDMAIPALRSLSPGQYGAFCANLDELVKADDKLDLFEWTLQRILIHHLDPHFKRVSPARVRYNSLKPLAQSCTALLSTLAYIGHSDIDEATSAFAASASKLPIPNMKLLAANQCGLSVVAQALDQLAQVGNRQKKVLLQACATCIAADRKITVREAELFRAIGDSLGCPVPPLLPGQSLSAGS
jgi:Zn-dependent protease with chaperone function